MFLRKKEIGHLSNGIELCIGDFKNWEIFYCSVGIIKGKPWNWLYYHFSTSKRGVFINLSILKLEIHIRLIINHNESE